jgi:hypothetical protein
MIKRVSFVAISLGVAGWSVAASAGEVNGSTKHPKDDYSNGVSICKFSGLNDYPDGSMSGPPGRTQNFGQDVSNYSADPSQFNPGDFGACNAHLSPYRAPGNPNQ